MLAIIWLISRARHDNGLATLAFVRRISARGRFPMFYLATVGVTLLMAAGIMASTTFAGIPYRQAYFIVVLSFLLIHYVFDHLIFLDDRVLQQN